MAVAAAATVASLGAAPAAQAHDSVRGSVPADGSVLTTAPTQVVITMSATPLGAALTVSAPDGRQVQSGEVAVSGHDVVQQLGPLPMAGVYTAMFRVVSSDGHPVTKSISFTVPPEVLAPGVEPSVSYVGEYVTLGPDGNAPTASAAASAEVAAAPAGGGGSAGAVVAVLGGVLVLAAVGGAVVWRRRRSV